MSYVTQYKELCGCGAELKINIAGFAEEETIIGKAEVEQYIYRFRCGHRHIDRAPVQRLLEQDVSIPLGSTRVVHPLPPSTHRAGGHTSEGELRNAHTSSRRGLDRRVARDRRTGLSTVHATRSAAEDGSRAIPFRLDSSSDDSEPPRSPKRRFSTSPPGASALDSEPPSSQANV